MINRKNILILLINFFFITNAFSENIKFEAEKMDIEDNGNTIYAYNSNTFIKSENIIITSNKVKYDKIKYIITSNYIGFPSFQWILITFSYKCFCG